MTFCTAINCMDGRIQAPVFNYLSNRFGVDYVDVITEAGPVGVLAKKPESAESRSIFRRVEISINAHSSVGLSIAAHHDCAGNPVPDNQQKQDLQSSIKLLKERYPDLNILGLWIDSNWTIHEC